MSLPPNRPQLAGWIDAKDLAIGDTIHFFRQEYDVRLKAYIESWLHVTGTIVEFVGDRVVLDTEPYRHIYKPKLKTITKGGCTRRLCDDEDKRKPEVTIELTYNPGGGYCPTRLRGFSDTDNYRFDKF